MYKNTVPVLPLLLHICKGKR